MNRREWLAACTWLGYTKLRQESQTVTVPITIRAVDPESFSSKGQIWFKDGVGHIFTDDAGIDHAIYREKEQK